MWQKLGLFPSYNHKWTRVRSPMSKKYPDDITKNAAFMWNCLLRQYQSSINSSNLTGRLTTNAQRQKCITMEAIAITLGFPSQARTNMDLLTATAALVASTLASGHKDYPQCYQDIKWTVTTPTAPRSNKNIHQHFTEASSSHIKNVLLCTFTPFT